MTPPSNRASKASKAANTDPTPEATDPADAAIATSASEKLSTGDQSTAATRPASTEVTTTQAGDQPDEETSNAQNIARSTESQSIEQSRSAQTGLAEPSSDSTTTYEQPEPQPPSLKLMRPKPPRRPTPPPAQPAPQPEPTPNLVATPARATSLQRSPSVPVTAALTSQVIAPVATEAAPMPPEEPLTGTLAKLQPIPPPSEPMQYRAIGLIRGRYIPEEEQITRGRLVVEDGADIDAVLLGRVLSLVKKHIDLAEEHLWVVYPRTREREANLHAQIVGVWDPEKLQRELLVSLVSDGSEPSDSDDDSNDLKSTLGEAEDALAADAVEDESGAIVSDQDGQLETDLASDQSGEDLAPSAREGDDTQSIALPAEVAMRATDGYFSIRGEILEADEESQEVMVRIQQAPRKIKGKVQRRAFKLALKGVLRGRVIGHFWDLQVQRQLDSLIIQSGTRIGILPPKKRKKRKPGQWRGPNGQNRPSLNKRGPRKPRPEQSHEEDQSQSIPADSRPKHRE